MANRKISDLTALTAPATGDLLPIVDISEAAAADKNKKITYGELLASAPAGSAAAPSFSFEGDSNTGIYSPGTDQVAISTGGTARITVDASGNVNIDSNTVYVDAANNRVGIGTSAPSANLSIAANTNATLRLSGNPTSYGELIFSSLGSGYDAYGASIEGTGQNIGDDVGCLIFKTGSGTARTERLRIGPLGAVGIGTTSPTSKLDLVDTAADSILSIRAGSTFSPSIYFEASGSNAGAIKYDRATQALTFSNNSSTSERLRIDQSGRLLVGTSTASTIVGANSAVQIYGTTYDTASLAIRRSSSTAADSASLYLGRERASGTSVANNDRLGLIAFGGHDGTDLDTGAAFIEAWVDGTPGANDMPGRLVFSTTADGTASPTERMRIDSSGLMILAGPGIKFPATQVASADANTLDDYEEGTWTPSITGSSTAGTATYTSRSGSYTKTGNRVTCDSYIIWTGGTGTGNLRISGLPFAAYDGVVNFGIFNNIALTALYVPTAYASDNGTTIVINQYPVGGGGQTSVTYDSAGEILINMTYRV